MSNPLDEKIDAAIARIHTAVKTHDPIATLALFSGGHDSLACLLIALASDRITSAAHINTGIGIEATRTFVRETCQQRKCTLIEKCAAQNLTAKGEPDPQIYADLVRHYGFPGPGWHGVMYSLLKERPLRMLERELGANCRSKKKRRLLYLTGARSEESTRRMSTTATEPVVKGRVIWLNPIHDFTKLDCSQVIELFNAPRNPVVDLIHKSGECLCGAFANSDRPNELEELNIWDLTRPAYREIKALEAEIRPIKGWGWGERPPRRIAPPCHTSPGELCVGCKL